RPHLNEDGKRSSPRNHIHLEMPEPHVRAEDLKAPIDEPGRDDPFGTAASPDPVHGHPSAGRPDGSLLSTARLMALTAQAYCSSARCIASRTVVIFAMAASLAPLAFASSMAEPRSSTSFA